MLAVDHVIIGVENLDEASSRFAVEHGLQSVFGGRHAGMGTANHIVPLRRDYLELLAVVDADEFSRTGLTLPAPESFAGWMARTDDIHEVAGRLGLSVRSLSRQREDGSVIEWHLAGLELLGRDPALPVFIDWSPDDEHHPARMPVDHKTAVTGIAWIELQGDPERIARWCKGGDLPLRVTEGPSAVLAVGLSTADGEIELRYPTPG